MRAPFLPLTIVLAAALAACSQAPRPPLMSPISQVTDFGYANRDLTDGRIEVTYLGPSYRVSSWRDSRQAEVDKAKAQAEDLATWRAAQVALARGKPAFEIVDRNSNIEVDVRNYYDPYPYPYPFGYYPYYYARDPFYPVFPVLPSYSGYREARAQAEAKLTVQLLDKMKPGALNAQETADRLSQKYGPAANPANGTPPATDAAPKKGT
ncbi:MAG: CC0125/CC1285 family lipoprotein [Candidatus Eiseniibacteriota bacterium]